MQAKGIEASPEFDAHTTEILEVLQDTPNLTEWTYSEIKPFLQGTILELGSGLGNYSEKILRDHPQSPLILSDVNAVHLEQLRKRFLPKENVKVVKIDAGNATDFKQANLKLDTILAINVVEHVKDDLAVLDNVYRTLADNGRFVFSVPSYAFLFNSLDVALGHYRRYSQKELLEKIHKTPFKIEKIFYFDSPGIAGWYLAGNVFKQKTLNRTAMKVFNFLTPIFKFVEKWILRKKIGLLAVVVLKKET